MFEIPCPSWLHAMQLFLALLVGHAVADFPLQGEYLAIGKNRRLLIEMADPKLPSHIWVICMSAHCLIHAGAVWMITGVVWFGLVELVLHWILDYSKCEEKISYASDQLGHVICKGGYAFSCMMLS